MRSLIRGWNDSGWNHNSDGDRLSVFAPSPEGKTQYLSLAIRRVYHANAAGYQFSVGDIPSEAKYAYISDWAQFGLVPLKEGETVMIDRGEFVLECVIQECLHEGSAEYNEERKSWGEVMVA